MSLKILPSIVFPVTPAQANVLHENVVQLNLVDAGLNPRQQQAIGLTCDIYDLLAKSAGAIDYRGVQGHKRLYADAMAFVGTGSPIVTRHGDLKAAHLAIDYSDTQQKLAKAGMPPISSLVAELLNESRDFANLPGREDDRCALLLRYLLKK